MNNGVTCVVPARLGSTRFFRKLLAPIFGKPVIAHTLARAVGAGCFARVVCLTDSVEIGEAVAAHGFEWVLSGDAANGTERIARALDRLPGDLFVNLQGDEPAFPEDGLRTLCQSLSAEPGAVHLLVHEDEPSAVDIANPHRVKTIVGHDGTVRGFTRTVAGFYRTAPSTAAACGPAGGLSYRLQLGAYAYSRSYLERYAALPPSADETALSHEMLRAPHLATLRAHPSRPGASVDVEEDLAAARAALESLLREDAPRPTRVTAPAAVPGIAHDKSVDGTASTPQNFTTQKTQPRLQGASA